MGSYHLNDCQCTFRIQVPGPKRGLQPGGGGGGAEGGIEATPAETSPTELHSSAAGPVVGDSQRPKLKPEGADIDIYLPLQPFLFFQSFKVEESSMGF